MDTEELKCAGRVKWFDASRGFGFVLCDELEGDVLLHANVLRNFGVSSVAEGAEISFMAQRSERGLQVVQILAIVPNGPELGDLADLTGLDAAELAQLPLKAARVKWFNKGKGFGFANLFGDREDVFIHADIVRRSGLATLQPGEAVALKVTEGDRGLMAVCLQSWDSAAG